MTIDSAFRRRGLFVDPPPDPTQAGGGGGEGKPSGPSWVPAEEFKQFQATMLQQFETLNSAMQALTRTPGPAAPSAPSRNRITNEEYEKAVQESDARTISAYIDQKISDVRSSDIEPLRVTGLDSIANLTREVVVGRLPYYAKFKAEIDKYIDGLPPQAKLSPLAYKIAHDAVVGQHHDELVKEATEAAIRQAQGTGGSTKPGETGSGRQAGGTKKTPTVKEAFGEDAALALSSIGRDEEAFARRLGYKSWADYVQMAEKQEQGA